MAIRRELGRRVLFELERLLVRGAHFRFLFVAAVIGLVSLVGGLAVRGTGEQRLGAEIWWAFLRLSDPGYLGDDVGLWRRMVSTLLTIAGYVVFLGAMVAILTQWLNDTLERLEAGRTPVRMNGHVVVLGWTPAVRAICGNLLRGETRLAHWLEVQGLRRLRIAVLAPSVSAERVQELEDGVGRRARRSSVVLRSGSPLRRSHLRRVDVQHAACVVIPGAEGTSTRAEDYDPTVLKVLRTIALDVGTEELPSCVCEILDPRRIPLARRAYPGPLEVLASDVFVGRLLAESLRSPGVAAVCTELLTHGEGATLYVLDWPGEATTFADAQLRMERATIVGVVVEDRFTVAPPDDLRIESDAVLVVVARAREDLVVSSAPRASVAPAQLVLSPPSVPERRALVLGWNRRVVDLVEGLRERESERWFVDVMSVVGLEERARLIPDCEDVRHIVDDPTLPSSLAEVDPQHYDRLVLLAGSRAKSDEEADARTIATFLGLEEVLPPVHRDWPATTIELLGRHDDELLDSARVEVVDGARLISLALAQIVLRRELHAVLDDIFGTGSSSIEFVRPQLEGTTRFDAAAAAVRRQGAVALGIRHGGLGGALDLLPEPSAELDPAAGDELVIVAGPDLDV